MPETGVVVVLDHLEEMLKSLTVLAANAVFVGVPDEHADRREGEISNAALGYIFENGAPEINMPARPSLLPGVKAVQAETIDGFKKATEFALAGQEGAVERQLHRIGLTAQNSVRAKVTEGIPPPLAPSTIAGRISRIKGRKRRSTLEAQLMLGTAPSKQAGAEGLFTPLVVTGQFLHSITYVIRGPHGSD